MLKDVFHRILFAGLLTVLLTTTANAFDGIRRGFVVGAGVGLTANAGWSADFSIIPDQSDNTAGFGGAFLLGYAWDNQNMIVLEANGTRYSTDIGTREDVSVVQGFVGPAWYHYFGPTGTSMYTVVGAGAYIFQWEHDALGFSDENDPGPGVVVGGGYEFTDQLQVGISVGAGRTEESEAGTRFDHTHINVMLSYVVY
ncbi:MAG: outer membrane beta-barrel protein [candidate division Zixibacteria bacterium]|nr:outer membrane beta-barrel protein [candidate division Zixibacteria bacterium]